ncbi:hypothetical protein [Sphingomonas sp.]|uniref:hypothetical protein n=1 Tax=Sphingomonas sp. TaxID=28214 RepID=UPI0035C80608
MPYTAGLVEAKRKLSQLEQARARSGTAGDSSHYALARARLLEQIALFEKLTARKG